MSEGDIQAGAAAVSRDAFLGGLVEVCQPKAGHHRAGLDAVMLAAALPQETQGRLLDLGAGVGVAGLCAAARLPQILVRLVERDETALALARQSLSLRANAAFAGRVEIVPADVIAAGRVRRSQGLIPGSAEHVIMNPPYYDSRHRPSPHAARAGAHVLGEGGLERWLRTASGLLVPGGSVTWIFRADALDEALAAMRGRFGGITVYPLYPRAGEAAQRIILRGIRGSRAPLLLAPGLVLHEGTAYSPAAEAVLRTGAGLSDLPWVRER